MNHKFLTDKDIEGIDDIKVIKNRETVKEHIRLVIDFEDKDYPYKSMAINKFLCFLLLATQQEWYKAIEYAEFKELGMAGEWLESALMYSPLYKRIYNIIRKNEVCFEDVASFVVDVKTNMTSECKREFGRLYLDIENRSKELLKQEVNK